MFEALGRLALGEAPRQQVLAQAAFAAIGTGTLSAQGRTTASSVWAAAGTGTLIGASTSSIILTAVWSATGLGILSAVGTDATPPTPGNANEPIVIWRRRGRR